MMRTYRPRYLIHSAAAAEAEATSCYRDALIKALVEELLHTEYFALSLS